MDGIADNPGFVDPAHPMAARPDQVFVDGAALTQVATAAQVTVGTFAVDQALQLHGGMGYMREAEVERQYRDMRIMGIGGGTDEILTGLAAKTLGYVS